MKIITSCEICGKRAKRWPKKNGYNLCMKHYNLMLDNKIQIKIKEKPK